MSAEQEKLSPLQALENIWSAMQPNGSDKNNDNEAESTMSKAVLYLNSQTQEKWDLENPTYEEKLKDAVLMAAETIVFLDIGPADGEVQYWAKKFSKRPLDTRLLNSHIIAWKSIKDSQVTVNGKLEPPPKGGISYEFMKGYEMLNSPGDADVDQKTASISAVMKYLFKAFITNFKKNYYDQKFEEVFNSEETDKVIIVIPVPHYYTSEDKKAMLKAAEDAELSKYGNVLFEDSLYLLAHYTLDSAEGNHTIRCLNLEASKFESIEVNCNHDGVKRIENAHQLGEGFVDMVKDIESLLRKEWLISTVCNKDLKQIANDVFMDSVYMASGTGTCYVAGEDLEDAVKKEMDDDEDKDEFVDTKQSQIKALVDHRHYQMYNICREIGETQDFENQLKAKLKEHKVVFQNNFPEDVDAEFKIFMASPEAQKTMWELLHGNKLNNEEDIVLSDRKRDVLISGESIQKFVEDIIQMKFKKDILEKEFKRGKEECKMDSLRLHGILTGVHYLKTDDDFFVQHLSLATTFFEHCPAITPE